MDLFWADKFKALYSPSMILCGEGYGGGVQGYKAEPANFILFDVMIDGLWLERHNVHDIAQRLGIKEVPEIMRGTLAEMCEFTRIGFDSQVVDRPAEGLVIRPVVELSDRRGERLIAKIKQKDFTKIIQNSS